MLLLKVTYSLEVTTHSNLHFGTVTTQSNWLTQLLIKVTDYETVTTQNNWLFGTKLLLKVTDSLK